MSPDVQSTDAWGWTSYRPTGWVNADGRKQYRAIFQRETTPLEYERQWVTFYARHPVKALREIVTLCSYGGDRQPTDYTWEVVN